jgi:hypothetical protein
MFKLSAKKRGVFLMAAALAGLLWATAASAYTLEVVAGIDGSDYLYVQGTNVWWEHRNYTAVGYHGDIGGSEANPQPTYLTTIDMGTVAWHPVWPNGHGYQDVSNPFTSLNQGLAAIAQTVTLDPVAVRSQAYIVQQPDAGNGYTLKVLFNDDSWGGAAWYDIKLNYAAAAPLPGTAVLLGSGLLGLLGWRRSRQG